MNKATKRILIILISILFILSIPIVSRAITFNQILTNGDSFLSAGSSSITVTPAEGDLKNISNTVSNVLLTIALGVTLISAVVMAINFAIQSVEDKAKIKESMIPWIIGIAVSFGAFGIWKLTMSIFYGL